MLPTLRGVRDRIIDGSVTASDLNILFLQTRDERFGSFIRDMGDLIAHPNKDKGPIIERLIYHRAQVELLGNKLERINGSEIIFKDGSCEWWLRHYMLARIEESQNEILLKHGIIKSEQIKIVKNQFPHKKNEFQEKIKPPLDQRFFEMLKTFSSLISKEGPFSESDAHADISRLINFLDIEYTQKLSCDFLMCMMVNIHNAEFLFPNGEKVSLRLHVERTPAPGVEQKDWEFWSPHGDIQLISTSYVESENGRNVGISMPFFKTEIRSEDYLHNDLITSGPHGTHSFDLAKDIEYRQDAPRIIEYKSRYSNS